MNRILLLLGIGLLACTSTKDTTADSFQSYNSIEPCNGELIPPEPLNFGESLRIGGYPEDLRRDRIEGDVLLNMVVTKEGNTELITILSSEHQGLNEPARKSAAALKFKPGTCDGTPVASYIEGMPITYRVN